MSKIYNFPFNSSALEQLLEMQEKVEKKPCHIKCYKCKKEIGMRAPALYYFDPKIIYCQDCWNLKKLKE